MKNLQKIYKRFTSNLKLLKFEGVVLSIILIFVIFIILANLLRTISSGQSNFATFLEEQKDLDLLVQRNEELKTELNYVNSDEYKALLLRDSQNLAKTNENLFTTKTTPNFLDREKLYLNVKTKDSFFDWWIKLIQ